MYESPSDASRTVARLSCSLSVSTTHFIYILCILVFRNAILGRINYDAGLRAEPLGPVVRLYEDTVLRRMELR